MNHMKLPDWLTLWIWNGLLGEIYPAIRAIAVAFSDKKELTIRYYLDKKPSEDDYDKLEVVVTNILANTSSNSEITSVKAECSFEKCPINKLDKLDGFVYARMETQNDW